MKTGQIVSVRKIEAYPVAERGQINVNELLASIVARKPIYLGRQLLKVTDRLVAEIQRMNEVYGKIAAGARALADQNLSNNKSSLLLLPEGDHYQTRNGQYVHRPGWDLCFASLLRKQTPAKLFSSIETLYRQFRQAHPFLVDGRNFLPQRMEMLHFHLAVGREITASVPSEAEKQEGRRMFLEGIGRVAPTIGRPKNLVGGLIMTSDGAFIVKNFPLDENILRFREQAEDFSQKIDEIFPDKNKEAGARKVQTVRANHIILGRLTRQVSPGQWSQLVNYTESRQEVLGYYEMREGYVVIEQTSYFEGPGDEIIPIAFGGR